MERSNLTFLKQAARDARPERGEPIAPHPTTRGQFQRTHPRGRAWPGGGARSLLASLRPEAPRAPFCVLVRRPRAAAHGTRGETRLHPAQPRDGGSNAPTREGVRGRAAEQALFGSGWKIYHRGLQRPQRRDIKAGRGRRTARGGRAAYTLPRDTRAVPTRPPARACVAGGRSARAASIPLSLIFAPFIIIGLPFLRFVPQTTRGARREGGHPLEPRGLTRGRFQRAHPRVRARPGGGASADDSF